VILIGRDDLSLKGFLMDQLLKWAQEVQAIAQSGLAYTQNPFDKQRYQELSKFAAQMMASATGAEISEVNSVFEAQSGYATPKVDVRGVVFKGKKILLVRELLDGGKWTLPGGWVDINEPPSLAVEREVREEAGMIVKARKVAAVFDRNLHGHPPYPFHSYKLFIICDLIAEATPDPLETADPTFFAQNQIPELSLPRVTPEEIAAMYEHFTDPDRPTDFD
jgi:ADP-ribose pyrophosphatase YjhB (NUDIX family)